MHPGILDQQQFDKHFSLHCYAPTAALAPFVTHIFIQRTKRASPPCAYRPLEILSGPNIYLFFTPKKSFIHTITSGVFEYDTTEAIVAGVKFRPGGFRALCNLPLPQVSGSALLTQVLPCIPEDFGRGLVNQNNDDIVRDIQQLLERQNPVYDKNMAAVDKAMALLESADIASVEGLARAMGKSERSLQSLFKGYVGVGVKWVLTRRRLLKTLDYIDSDALSTWSQAAVEAGYSTPSHFSNDFKTVLGISPTAYVKAIDSCATCTVSHSP